MQELGELGRQHVSVDALVLTEHSGALQLLLGRRTAPPYAGRWALPGRFVALDESAETTVQRLLSELLPVPPAYMEQLYTFSDVNRDPRGRVISIAYLLIIPWPRLAATLREGKSPLSCFSLTKRGGQLQLRAADGTQLIGSDLAYDHSRIIDTGIRRLRGKLDYTDIGFYFLPDSGAFTLGELQQVFEAVTGKALDSSNFRRFIRKRYEEKGRIEPTERETRQRRGRPAALYRLAHTGTEEEDA